MTTAKQRAAARRNIKKARAALRRGKRGGKICFNTIKATANWLQRHGYRVTKK